MKKFCHSATSSGLELSDCRTGVADIEIRWDMISKLSKDCSRKDGLTRGGESDVKGVMMRGHKVESASVMGWYRVDMQFRLLGLVVGGYLCMSARLEECVALVVGWRFLVGLFGLFLASSSADCFLSSYLWWIFGVVLWVYFYVSFSVVVGRCSCLRC